MSLLKLTLYLCAGLIGFTKSKNGVKKTIEPFPPGTFEEYDLLDNGGARLVRKQIFHKPGDKPRFLPFVPYETLSKDPLKNINTLLTQAVKKRLMADRRIGCLLSGGLDSSLIAALLVREAKKANVPYKIQVDKTALIF